MPNSRPASRTLQTWSEYIDRLRSNFPAELLSKKIWLRWKSFEKDGRRIKFPVPSYDRVSEYLCFEDAACFPGFGFAGLGVANVGQDFTIIDIDSLPPGVCGLKPGAPRPPLVLDHDLSTTYWEFSPSGSGLRGFLHGRLPEGGKGVRVIGGAEIYRDKWATVTADSLSDYPRQLAPLPAWLIEDWRVLTVLYAPKSDPNVEPGPWDALMLRERLEAWRKFIPDFRYADYGERFAVSCPGNREGWPDSSRHTKRDLGLSATTTATVINGLPTFHCFHAHCEGKTWRDFQDFYDPDRLWHTVERSLEDAIYRLQGGRIEGGVWRPL